MITELKTVLTKIYCNLHDGSIAGLVVLGCMSFSYVYRTNHSVLMT